MSVPTIRGGGMRSEYVAPPCPTPDQTPSFDQESRVFPDDDADVTYQIPSYGDLSAEYEKKWLAEREKFYNQLKANFRAVTSQFKSGRTEIYSLNITPYTDKYIKAFRELFPDTAYQASVGEVEHTTNGKKLQKLYITLPDYVR